MHLSISLIRVFFSRTIIKLTFNVASAASMLQLKAHMTQAAFQSNGEYLKAAAISPAVAQYTEHFVIMMHCTFTFS
jgi:hypothetical protein